MDVKNKENYIYKLRGYGNCIPLLDRKIHQYAFATIDSITHIDKGEIIGCINEWDIENLCIYNKELYDDANSFDIIAYKKIISTKQGMALLLKNDFEWDWEE